MKDSSHLFLKSFQIANQASRKKQIAVCKYVRIICQPHILFAFYFLYHSPACIAEDFVPKYSQCFDQNRTKQYVKVTDCKGTPPEIIQNETVKCGLAVLFFKNSSFSYLVLA